MQGDLILTKTSVNQTPAIEKHINIVYVSRKTMESGKKET